jgi:hypothetical protein
MTIRIDKAQVTAKGAIEFISEPDDLVTKIVEAWHRSDIAHCFKNKRRFKEAVRRNQKTLKSWARDGIDMLFTRSNYLFSTQAECREETLYFKDGATGQTGRLRQQHSKGPLVKIDKEPRTHLFLSKKWFEYIKEWRDKHKGGLPRFYVFEIQAKNDKHHLEVWCDGKEVSGSHLSGGTVETSRRHIERRIDHALKEILGIGHK